MLSRFLLHAGSGTPVPGFPLDENSSEFPLVWLNSPPFISMWGQTSSSDATEEETPPAGPIVEEEYGPLMVFAGESVFVPLWAQSGSSAAVVTPPPPEPPQEDVALGVFFHRPASTEEPQYVAWLGRTPDVNSEFSHGASLFNSSWSWLTSVDSSLFGAWGAWLASHPGRRIDLALGMQAWSGSTRTNSGNLLGEIAAGLHDSKFAAWATSMHNAGLSGKPNVPTYIRLGWEMNGRFFPWGVGVNTEGPAPGIVNFAPAWQQVVDVLRATVPSNNWKFALCPTMEGFIPGTYGNDWMESIYPGNDYVDLIGMDIYDRLSGYYPPTNSTTWLNSWNNFELICLQECNTFAQSKGKRQMLGEFGPMQNFVLGGLDRGGGDNALFINNLYNWVITHDFEYVLHFDSDDSTVNISLSQPGFPYPNVTAAFFNTFKTLPHPW